ncbi:carboxyl-terminal-processing peptidase 3, chloroplastic-like isoform X2 [Durio zibethinus]|uniref:C-terminal processing peptidase n=1 Tax=Durio zibethinus TaxID=66656 RepID=A0A6P6APB6_DURZI|nr:carboxyl-terminal-processing peptidase 3, chloroplastic-like isoform X2 [Durio zibethinus]
MEPLSANFELLNASRPTSIPLFSRRFSWLNRGISKKSSVSLSCGSYNHNHNHHQAVKTEGPRQQSSGHDLVQSITKGFLGFAAAATALASVCADSPAFAESLTVAFPASRAQEVNTVQRTLVEAWGLIRETFVDPTFNHQDWDLKLQQTMVEMFPLNSADAAYGKIRGMLSTLGDPFTRIISPKEYQSFRIGSDGNLQGVGLFINVEPKTGHLVVLSCLEGTPAARAGIHEGDELIEINGQRLDGVDGEAAAQMLRGQAGTSVTVKLHTGNDSGRGSSTKETAATDMENTIQEMENQGVQSYILDLRNNPGGLVKAGLDVAKIWLDGTETLVNTVDRDGHMSPINMINGHAVTHDPLVVLVNEGSASASEILAGALHDNGRAILVGHKTFGKGKIQSVTELHDGFALFITVAKYLSPALHDIDQVGIIPDVQCTTDMLNSSPKETLMKDKSSVLLLEADSCIMVAEHELDIQESKGTVS